MSGGSLHHRGVATTRSTKTLGHSAVDTHPQLVATEECREYDDRSALGHNFLDNAPVDVGEAEIPPRVAVGELFVVETE